MAYYCSSCGHELIPNSRFCNQCGAPIQTMPGTPQSDIPQPDTPQPNTPQPDIPQPDKPHPTASNVRCLNYGADGPAGGACSACLLPLLSKEEYEEKLRRHTQVQMIERGYSAKSIFLLWAIMVAVEFIISFVLPQSVRDDVLFGPITIANFFRGIFLIFGTATFIIAMIRRTVKIQHRNDAIAVPRHA